MAASATDVPTKKKKKKTQGWKGWLKDGILHLWHGFRLLALNTRITMRLKRQMMSGQKPTRRERQLLEKTTSDLLRLVPFSVFVIIPGGELLLPVALAIFPNLLPSTFVTKDQTRQKQITSSLERGTARRKLFEHMVTQIIYFEKFSPDAKAMPVFRQMTVDGVIDETSIRSLAKYFDDDGPLALEKLPRYVLRELSIAAGLSSGYSSRAKRLLLPRSIYEAVTRHDINKVLEFRQKDDLSLSKVDLSTLTPQETQHECASRKLVFLGPCDVLKKQLSDWISLSLDEELPSHMLLFIKPCAVPFSDIMKSLSKEERDRILGLEQFKDSVQVKWMRSLTENAEAAAQEELSSIPDSIPLEEIKQHIEEEKQELDAAANQFADLRASLPADFGTDLLALFDRLVDKSGLPDSSGQIGVKVTVLDDKVAHHFSEHWSEWKCAPQRIVDCFHDFEFDKSGVISREDFEGVLKRIQGG